MTFFFVLSGFILTYAHLEFGKSEKLNLGAVAYSLSYDPYRTRLFHWPRAFGAVFYCQWHSPQYFRFAICGRTGARADCFTGAWFPSTAILWNTPAWSLSVEMFLYVSFAPLVHIVGRRRSALLIFAYTLVCTFSIAKIYFENNRPANIDFGWWHNLLDYFPLWHLPQFVLGIALGKQFIFGKRFSHRIHEVILFMSLLAIAAILYYHVGHPMLSSNFILAPIFGALIFGAAGAIGPLSKALSAPSLVLLGEASYAIYIIHSPLNIWWQRVTMIDLQIELPPFFDFSCYLLIVFGASTIIYSYIERPIRRWLLIRTNKIWFARKILASKQ